MMQQQKSQNEGGPGIAAVIIGVAAVALCCFGLLLAAGAGAAGIGALTHSLRYILPIVVAVLVVVGVISYRRWKSRSSGR
jgi:F0F1-type ATP synthase assembly protein I